MNNIVIFEKPEFSKVRTLTDDKGEPWFIGKDIAKALGYSNAGKAVMVHVDDGDKKFEMIEAYSQDGVLLNKTRTALINESGVYSLILSSKLPEAEKFKRWITHEVLPQIRKTGGYIPVYSTDDVMALADRALEIIKKQAEEKKRIKKLHPEFFQNDGN